MTGHTMTRLVISMLLCLPWISTARAQSGANTLTQGKHGCSQCSPPHNQELAQKLFQDAREFLAKAQYEDAAALYERALTHWDNPLIRYGLARALYLQRRFAEAHAHVAEVLAYGAACFDPRMWENVQKLAAFLRESLADMGQIEILCREPDAQIDVDGMPGFVCSEPVDQTQATCPKPEVRVEIRNGWAITRRGEASRFLPPGTYRITASKPGHDTVGKPVVVAAGNVSRVEIDLEVTRQEQRERGWPVFLAWSMASAGAATVGVGGLLHSNADEPTNGAMFSYGLGGTVAVTGVVWLLLEYNRDAPRTKRSGSSINVLPSITGDSAGALIDFEF
jgi:hypothetical protein